MKTFRAGRCKRTEPHDGHEWRDPLMSVDEYFICPGNLTERVNHPLHYGGDTTYEVIKVIEAWGLDDFCLGNTIKYVARAGKKDGAALLDDLEKARWYLERKIARLKENGENHAPPT